MDFSTRSAAWETTLSSTCSFRISDSKWSNFSFFMACLLKYVAKDRGADPCGAVAECAEGCAKHQAVMRTTVPFEFGRVCDCSCLCQCGLQGTPPVARFHN